VESVDDLGRLAKSFERHLRVENKAPKTVETYQEGVGQLLESLRDQGVVGALDVDKGRRRAAFPWIPRVGLIRFGGQVGCVDHAA
jgi:hypothetical protein